MGVLATSTSLGAETMSGKHRPVSSLCHKAVRKAVETGEPAATGCARLCAEVIRS